MEILPQLPDETPATQNTTLRNLLLAGGLSGLAFLGLSRTACSSADAERLTASPGVGALKDPGAQPGSSVPAASQAGLPGVPQRVPATVVNPQLAVDICAAGATDIARLNAQIESLAHDFGERMLPLWEERDEQATQLELDPLSGLDEAIFRDIRSELPPMTGSPGRQELFSQIHLELIERIERTFPVLEQGSYDSVRYSYDLPDPPDTREAQFRNGHGEPVSIGVWKLVDPDSGKEEWRLYRVGNPELYLLPPGENRDRIANLAQVYFDNADRAFPWTEPERSPGIDEASPFFALDTQLRAGTVEFGAQLSNLLEERRETIRQMLGAGCPNTPNDALDEDTLSWISSGLPFLAQHPEEEAFANSMRVRTAQEMAALVRQFEAHNIPPLSPSEFPSDIVAQVSRAQTSEPPSVYGIIRSSGDSDGSSRWFIWKQEGPGQFNLYRLIPEPKDDLVFSRDQGAQLVVDYMWANHAHLGPDFLLPWEIGE